MLSFAQQIYIFPPTNTALPPLKTAFLFVFQKYAMISHPYYN